MKDKYLLALNAHPKIGSQTIKKLLAIFNDDAERIWKDRKTIEKVDPKFAKLVEEAVEMFDPDKELEKLSQHDLGYITMYDKYYPSQLKELHDCPVVLYIKGNIAALSEVGIGIVGSRKFTSYGKQVTDKLARECARNGLSVISGLALGIDTIAHQAVVEEDGLTVGVLGCGLDQIYPQSNVALAKRIVETNGAVISEFAPGTAPLKFNFPARNRIIAGLSRGVLVIEAAEKSGALITAFCALEYNREVFAVPGSIFSENSIGTHKLIQQGAKLVTSCEDILNEFNLQVRRSQTKVKTLLPETAEEEIILKILAESDKLADAIVFESKLNIIAVNTTLTILEMKGMVENVGGGVYRKIN